MAYHDTLSDLTDSDRGRRLLKIAAVSIVGFVIIDWAIIHPFVWHNTPGAYYFLIKPLFVGLGLIGVTWWLVTSQGIRLSTALLVGAVSGIGYLQFYYSLFPIRMADGTAVQIDFVGNFTSGLMTHLGGLVLAIVVALLLFGGES